jgi:uncharacterized protein YqeY
MELRATLRADLMAAMKAREIDAVSVLRTAIAEIDNAESVDPKGLTATEVPRRVLSSTDVGDILRRLVDDYLTEADGYDSAGQHDAAARLRRQAAVVAEHLR